MGLLSNETRPGGKYEEEDGPLKEGVVDDVVDDRAEEIPLRLEPGSLRRSRVIKAGAGGGQSVDSAMQYSPTTEQTPQKIETFDKSGFASIIFV